jgi:hypothetical protein
MPRFAPTRLSVEKTGLPYAMYFVSHPVQDKQGVIVKALDGTFSWRTRNIMLDETIDGTVYEIGREGYYLTLAEAREAINNSDVYGISYTDDYNDEYQDFFICNTATNTPDVTTDTAEAIA